MPVAPALLAPLVSTRSQRGIYLLLDKLLQYLTDPASHGRFHVQKCLLGNSARCARLLHKASPLGFTAFSRLFLGPRRIRLFNFQQLAGRPKYISNSTGASISAQNNCWNVNGSGCSPASSKFVGTVDYSDPDCCSFAVFSHNEGEPEFEEGFVFQLPGSAASEPRKRLVTGLVGIVPNPFNPQTTIEYSLAAQGRVEINVYDVAGRLVQVLANEVQVPGEHTVVWEGTDRRGSPVASGVYFVRMAATGHVFTWKMVLLK